AVIHTQEAAGLGQHHFRPLHKLLKQQEQHLLLIEMLQVALDLLDIITAVTITHGVVAGLAALLPRQGCFKREALLAHADEEPVVGIGTGDGFTQDPDDFDLGQQVGYPAGHGRVVGVHGRFFAYDAFLLPAGEVASISSRTAAKMGFVEEMDLPLRHVDVWMAAQHVGQGGGAAFHGPDDDEVWEHFSKIALANRSVARPSDGPKNSRRMAARPGAYHSGSARARLMAATISLLLCR